MRRRTKSTIWPHPERWGDRQRRHPYRRRLLNWECDQQMWTPLSDRRIEGRRIWPASWGRTPRLKSEPGAVTVSVALLRQRVAHRRCKQQLAKRDRDEAAKRLPT